MEFDIHLIIGEANFCKGKMQFCKKNDDIWLEFSNSEGKFLFSDQITSFDLISFDDMKPNNIILSGTVIRRISFSNSSDVARFWTFLQKYLKFSAISGKKREFSMRLPPNNNSSQIVFTKSHRIPHKAKIQPLYPSTHIADKVFALTQSSQSAKNSLRPQYAEIMLKKLYEYSPSKLDDYSKLKEQWSNLSEAQWAQHESLRAFVKGLETYVENCPLHSQQMKNLLIDVLMSFFFVDPTIEFVPSIARAATFFVQTFVVGFSSSDCFFCFDGRKLTFIEAASMCFYSLFDYFTKFIDQSTFSIASDDEIKLSISGTIEKVLPQLGFIAADENFNWASESMKLIASMFFGIRPMRNSQAMLCDILTSDSPKRYSVSILSAFLAFLLREFPNIAKINPGLCQEFILSFASSADIELILLNARQLDTFLTSS